MGRQEHGRAGRTVALLVGGLLALTGLLFPGPGTPTASADPGDIGYEGPSFTGVTNPPTSDKPQSKLWHNDGSWWANMYDAGSGTWHIFRLDRPTETWVDTGVRVDDRRQTLADALWDGNKLYIASHWVTVSTTSSVKTSISGRPARLYRYSYDSATKSYSLDAGFPATINNFSSESLTIDKDSTGRLWATWTQVSGSTTAGYTSRVYVSYTDGSDLSWATPMTPAGAGNISPDDISAVVAYRGRVGVMWSNQLDGTVYWAWRNDTEGPTSWHLGVAVRGTKVADDHLNLKALMSDTQGRVYAVTKTSLDELSGAPKSSAQIRLLVFLPGTGAWSATTFGTLSDCHTRPVLVLDEQNQRVNIFATAPTASGCPYSGADGTIYMKSAPMSNPVFPSGRGTPVVRDASSAHMNDVTSTKQPVNAQTGLVVLASNDSTDRYWHADIAVAGTPVVPAPVSSFTATPQSGTSPLTVQFTDTSTNTPTGWSWDFGDGRTSTVQNPSITYQDPGTFTVTLVARNATGTGSTATRTITVSAPTPEPVPVSSFTATPQDGTAPLAVQLTDTSTNTPTGWAWDFGDGRTSTVQNPSVTYQDPGTYTVTLVARNATGTGSTATRTITVSPPSTGTGITRMSSASAVSTTASTVLTIPTPSGTQAGDVLVSCLALNGSSITAAPPGWIRVAASTGVSNPRVYGYYKIAGSSEPPTTDWTFSASITSGGGIARYSGAQGVDGTASIAAGASATTATVPGVTASVAGDMLIGCMGINSGSTSVGITGPSDLAQAWDIGGKRHEYGDGPLTAAGATGPRTWTFTSGREWAGWLMALRP